MVGDKSLQFVSSLEGPLRDWRVLNVLELIGSCERLAARVLETESGALQERCPIDDPALGTGRKPAASLGSQRRLAPGPYYNQGADPLFLGQMFRNL